MWALSEVLLVNKATYEDSGPQIIVFGLIELKCLIECLFPLRIVRLRLRSAIVVLGVIGGRLLELLAIRTRRWIIVVVVCFARHLEGML